MWVVSGSVYQKKEYQKGLQTLLSHQEEKVFSQLTRGPRISGLAGVLNFLAFLFKSGFEYRTIYTHRSAISALHNIIERRPVGENLQVSSLITGVFSDRPTLA